MTLKHLTHDNAMGYAALLIAEDSELTDEAMTATFAGCTLVPDITVYPLIRKACWVQSPPDFNWYAGE